MTARVWGAAAALLLAQSGLASSAGGQLLDRRVASALAGPVEFTFATRDGVCGDGRSYVHFDSYGGDSFYGSFYGLTAEPCVRGPARVVLDRAGNEVVSVRVYVGPLVQPAGTSLGAVPAREAAAYLLGLAATAQGAVARDAILPAMIADSTDNHDALLALARDHTRAREIRRSALSWLGRDGGADPSLPQELVSLADDQTDNESVRQQALNTLAHLPNGAGIPTLTRLAGASNGGWLARTALQAIAGSGDPRAHEYLRDAVTSAVIPDDALAVAVRGFGQEYATAADIKTIRDAWPRFTGQRTREAAIDAVAQFGGSDNVAWLLGVVRGMNTSADIRRRAVEAAMRAGVSSATLSELYDRTTDPDTKTAVISALGEIGDHAATDKLLAIARTDADISARRHAVSVLGRSSDPRVRDALAGIVTGRN